MANFIRAANPIWWLPDLTGNPLNDGYYASFLTNTLPYIPQFVFQDPDGFIPWQDPIQFQPAGTLPNNLYFNDTEVYRIEIRQGNALAPTSADPLIYLIENFVPGNSSTPSNNNDLQTAENLITNPQFADIFFTSPLVYTQGSSGNYTVQVGPGWFINLVGSGTLTLTQDVISGNNNETQDPPYALKINGTGWTSIQLIQTFANNGAIFSGGAMAVSFLARATGTTATISVTYMPSTGAAVNLTPIPPSVAVGQFNVYSGANNIPSSTNSDLGENAFVNIIFNIPVGSTVDLTNIIGVGQNANLPANFNPMTDIPAFDQLTYERIVDHEFNVYQPKLSYKPIPSYLVGWDFPVNPAQFFGDSVAAQSVGANKSYYVWDQTILFQSANSAITTARSADNGLSLTAAAATQMAVIQYLTLGQIRELLTNPLSVYLSGYSTNNTQVCISLWYTTAVSLPSVISSNQSLVATLGSNGKPATFNGTGWTQVPPLNGQDPIITLQATGTQNSYSNFNDYSLNGYFNLNNVAQSELATFFSIVIGTNEMAIGNNITFNSVGLNLGNIATRPAPKTYDETLRDCQFYYEKSYETQTPEGSVTFAGAVIVPIQIDHGSPSDTVNRKSFTLKFKEVKRVIPAVIFYSPTAATQNQLLMAINQAGTGIQASAAVAISGWTDTWPSAQAMATTQSYPLLANVSNSVVSTGGPNTNNEGLIVYQYSADARLGSV